MIVKLIKNTAVFLITFFVMIALLDVYIKYAAAVQVTIYRYDPRIGRTFLNNAEYTLLTEGFAMGNINSYGYIGPAYGTEKPANSLRIALIGDSFIEGFQHFDRNHFRAILEKELREKYNINAEVMNFGKFGYNLLDMYSNYENYIKNYKPDITLFFVSNLDLVEAPERDGMPYPYVKDDSLKIFYYEDTGSSRPWFLSMNKMGMISPTVQMIRNGINLHRRGETMRIIFDKFYDPFDAKRYEEENAGSADAPAPVHTKILEELSRSKANIIVHRDKYNMNEDMKNMLYGSGINVIELNDTLRNTGQEGFNPYLWKHSGKEGHWNPQAHEIIGKFLARKIALRRKSF